MRIVKSFDDVNIVIKPIQDFISLFTTKDADRRRLRLKNCGDAIDPQDYVTLKQLQQNAPGTPVTDTYFTVVFSFGGVPAGGSAAPNWVTGKQRDGIPVEIWGRCDTAPNTGPFVFNVLLNGTALLASNLSITDTNQHHSSSFINPVPQLGLYSRMVPTLVSVNNAANISIGVVVKRNIPNG
jgi:hypothetical protein